MSNLNNQEVHQIGLLFVEKELQNTDNLKVVVSCRRDADPAIEWGWGLLRKGEPDSFSHVICVALKDDLTLHGYYVINSKDLSSFSPIGHPHSSEEHTFVVLKNGGFNSTATFVNTGDLRNFLAYK